MGVGLSIKDFSDLDALTKDIAYVHKKFVAVASLM